MRAGRVRRQHVELVDTVSTGDDVGAMLTGLREHLERLAGQVREPRAGRVVPLLAMPVPGTGQGNFHHRRGAVVKALVPFLQQAAAELGVDVALVTPDRRDHAAAQASRDSTLDLTPQEKAEADRLGVLAGRGELSVFVGAGASVPLGLPGWGQLVDLLLHEAGLGALPPGADDSTFKAGAELAHAVLGERMGQVLARELEVRHHALGHALLAALRMRQSVTTNFDTALELAMRPVHGEDLRVMTRQWARSCSPWLLKLHGSVDRPEGIVLTRSQYERHEREGRPLYGLVQGLLMTSHLLFVGFSLTDSAYLRLAEEVDHIYRSAARPGDTVATALGLDSLAEEGKALDDAFHHVAFREPGRSVQEAARTLEIFLDRMAWRATRTARTAHEYLLDDRYLDLVADDAHGLRHGLAALVPLARSATCEVARDVRDALERFGAERTTPGP
ncbi:SIR2-like protein [Ornithinimicrobium humiphilum]|uniref:SIR2-like protein n=1 Tax=Ornithinimicrobium humiphilum TaxID=125288 RepID=A0A543KMN2_9MICO|nr:SIR2-like protein [Ornithinimicrobium humiphilum]